MSSEKLHIFLLNNIYYAYCTKQTIKICDTTIVKNDIKRLTYNIIYDII